MQKDKLKKIIIAVSATWGVIALALFGLAVAQVLSMAAFQRAFVGGFVVWVVIVTVASQMLHSGGDGA